MDFNEVHITLTYPVIMGQTQADTVYVRGLTVKGTVLAEGTPLTGHARGHGIEGALQAQDAELGQHVDSLRLADMEARADAILEVIASP